VLKTLVLLTAVVLVTSCASTNEGAQPSMKSFGSSTEPTWNMNATIIEACSSGLFLTLTPHELDGRPPLDSDTMRTALDVAAKTERFGADRKRIIAGSPETSLVYELLTSRRGPKDQMPPIATQVVDPDHARIIGEWIRALDD
jgi:hypothetical protein